MLPQKLKLTFSRDSTNLPRISDKVLSLLESQKSNTGDKYGWISSVSLHTIWNRIKLEMCCSCYLLFRRSDGSILETAATVSACCHFMVNWGIKNSLNTMFVWNALVQLSYMQCGFQLFFRLNNQIWLFYVLQLDLIFSVFIQSFTNKLNFLKASRFHQFHYKIIHQVSDWFEVGPKNSLRIYLFTLDGVMFRCFANKFKYFF